MRVYCIARLFHSIDFAWVMLVRKWRIIQSPSEFEKKSNSIICTFLLFLSIYQSWQNNSNIPARYNYQYVPIKHDCKILFTRNVQWLSKRTLKLSIFPLHPRPHHYFRNKQEIAECVAVNNRTKDNLDWIWWGQLRI